MEIKTHDRWIPRGVSFQRPRHRLIAVASLGRLPRNRSIPVWFTRYPRTALSDRWRSLGITSLMVNIGAHWILRTYCVSRDLNAKSPSWGSRTLDLKGSQIEDLLCDNDLSILNDKRSTYLSKTNGTTSALDITAINHQTASQHWKVIKTLNNQSTHQKADLLTNIISSSGRDAATNKETASLLAKHYENKSKLTFNANDMKLLRTYRKTIQDSKRYKHKNIFTIPFLMEELKAAIAKMNPGKAPGPDVIFGRMVQHFGNLAKNELLEIFNLSWATGKLPKIWKLSTVIPILKPNKNASECKNYRPISLTSTLCQLMERVIHRRLMNWLIENKKLHFYQTAFRTHHSTTDQLFYLSQSIIDGFQEKPHKKTLAVFLDISAAFDRVWRQKLVHTIQGTGINGKALLWINDILRGRKFSVRFNGALSESRRMWAGVPQGSNSQIKKVDLPTYLGVTLDPELRFSKHIEQTANKALGKLNILRKLSGTSWGSRPQTLKSIFCTVIRPVLEYATPIWTPASISVKRKLDSVQHKAAKIIIGAVSSTNNEKAEQECGLPPLESRRKLATIKFTNKLRSYSLDHISRRVFDKWKHSTRLKRSSTLQLNSVFRKELNFNHSSLEFLQEPLIPKKTHQRTPVSNWNCSSHVPKKKTL
ncbi:RNA-directed DNA polymerase from mobile element jockey [Trichonephila clavipes]|nr:RNA-directed DNA polymerase from mobile element jockey [Trichonephila clavipes]